MGKILCATRGGEGSIRTQDAAIQRALTSGDELVFFYAVDLEFLADADYALRSDIVEEQMDNMGEFLLLMAVERAENQGVKASYLISNEPFAEAIVTAAQEEKASLVVVGRPADEDDPEALERLKELVKTLEAKAGIPFAILPEGD